MFCCRFGQFVSIFIFFGSSFTFYFKSPTDTTTWRTDFTNFGEFYGAEDVWKLGSEFFPLPVQNVTRTIEDEIEDNPSLSANFLKSFP